jgi:ABC-type transport system involved in cytochrome bd biosynthesis fused ATPase/permease subunit
MFDDLFFAISNALLGSISGINLISSWESNESLFWFLICVLLTHENFSISNTAGDLFHLIY